jgi:hypothetical protein
MSDEKYYEVEGAVLRESPPKPMELYIGNGKWREYTGDIWRVYRQSNALTLDEVKPYMDVPNPHKKN